ncbi:MAG: hypothetical protein QM442_10630, partial [Spirochaetota bacterium]|nr:hypothetical protein [Spirochaetota bacterium]
IARYSVMHGNEQLFAVKYKLYLPTEEELRAEIETRKTLFYLQQQEKKSENRSCSTPISSTIESIPPPGRRVALR